MNTYAFGRQKQIGKVGEQLALNYLKTQYKNITDVRDNHEFRSKDVDYVCDEKQIEVKTDTYYYTGNYFFETQSNIEKETPGCFMYSEADYWYYLYVPENELHIIPLKDVRTWFEKHKNEFKRCVLKTSVAGSYYSSEGYKVPRAAVPNIKIIKLGDTNEQL